MEAKKIGRPTESKKEFMIRVRMDKEAINKLEKCIDEINKNSKSKITRSQIIRAGIDETYENIIIKQDITKCEQIIGRINRKK